MFLNSFFCVFFVFVNNKENSLISYFDRMFYIFYSLITVYLFSQTATGSTDIVSLEKDVRKRARDFYIPIGLVNAYWAILLQTTLFWSLFCIEEIIMLISYAL